MHLICLLMVRYTIYVAESKARHTQAGRVAQFSAALLEYFYDWNLLFFYSSNDCVDGSQLYFMFAERT